MSPEMLRLECLKIALDRHPARARELECNSAEVDKAVRAEMKEVVDLAEALYDFVIGGLPDSEIAATGGYEWLARFLSGQVRPNVMRKAI